MATRGQTEGRQTNVHSGRILVERSSTTTYYSSSEYIDSTRHSLLATAIFVGLGCGTKDTNKYDVFLRPSKPVRRDWGEGRVRAKRRLFFGIACRSDPIPIYFLSCNAFAKKLFGTKKEGMVVRTLIRTGRQTMKAI